MSQTTSLHGSTEVEESFAAPLLAPTRGFRHTLHGLAGRERRALLALEAVRREILDIPDECRDPALARLKLGWWAEEIERLVRGEARHPAARALQEFTSATSDTRSILAALASAVAALLAPTPFADGAMLTDHARTTGGDPARLAVALLGEDRPDAPALAQALGSAGRLVRLLQRTGRDLRAGRVTLPLADLPAGCREAHDLLTDTGRQHAGIALRRTFALAQRAFAEADALILRDRRRIAPLIARAALDRALLLELQRADGAILFAHHRLTPFRKVWIARRALRKARAT